LLHGQPRFDFVQLTHYAVSIETGHTPYENGNSR
jgi:hypothetical protein